MNLTQVIEYLKSQPTFNDNIAFDKLLASTEASYAELPSALHPNLKEALSVMGIGQLYSHQRQAYDAYNRNENFVVTTPTASGKTLAYLLPILQDKLTHPEGKHLFMFPTKALAQDQLTLFRKWSKALGQDWSISTYDGDTPPQERRNVKKSGDFILTNPDMLHSGVLPHHLSWKNYFENLRTIVIDEMHTYLGIFGSNVANVLRRMNRLLMHYHADPRYIFSSATIANPIELAQNLSEKDFTLVSESGSPEGEKHFMFYNPPIIDEALNRQSPYRAAAQLGELLIKNGIATIFFARSRIRVELLVSLIRDRLPWHLKNKVKGYRGGYLPLERRKIEKGLREQDILGVVSTNALELGIDIGMLQAVVSIGYPGRVSSLLQQFGRAGRKKEPALAIMVATPSALDQYLMHQPQYFLESSGEAAIINPNNLMIFMQHLKCAAYEKRFREDDYYSGVLVKDYLEHLTESKLLVKREDTYLWSDRSYPAADISLRSAAQDNFVIVNKTKTGDEVVIGEVDYFSAPTMIHSEAIYIHQGKHFYVDILKWKERRAEVKEVESDYYTDAHQKANLSVIADDEQSVINVKDSTMFSELVLHWGEVTVNTKAYLYKKIKIKTSENLGWGEIHTPEIDLHTQASWLEFSVRNNALDSFMGQLLARAAYVLKQMAPLVALCDIRDLSVQGLFRDDQFKDQAIVFYDNFPGGVGLSTKLVRNIAALIRMAIDAIDTCQCKQGCPSCIGVWEITQGLEESMSQAEIDEQNEKFYNFEFKKECLKLLCEIESVLAAEKIHEPATIVNS